MNIVTLVLLTLFSVLATAHPGHGETSVFNHSLEHAFGYTLIAAMVAIILFVTRKRR
jgi:hypothetical protein